MTKPPKASSVADAPDDATYLGSWPTLHPSSGVVEVSDYYLLPGDRVRTTPDLIWRRTANHWYFVCFADEWPARRAQLDAAA